MPLLARSWSSNSAPLIPQGRTWGVDLEARRQARTDLDAAPAHVGGLLALGEAVLVDPIDEWRESPAPPSEEE